MIRAFLAVDPSPSLREAIASVQSEIKRGLHHESNRARISWVQPASIHLTLIFFGDMEERMVALLQEAITSVAAVHQPLDIPLQQIGAFPRLQAPRVLWVGPSHQWEEGETARRFLSMQQAMAEACETLGFAREAKAFHPHLTIARIMERERSVGDVLTARGMNKLHVALEPLVVDSLVLMKSDLRPTGSVYTKLWDVPLKAS